MSLSSPFGRYWLEERIATGGMAEIFKAKLVGVEGFEKRVVIKRILPFWSERRDFISMLVDEAKVLVHLNHPNIVQVYELGRVGPTYFIAMEYVEGGDLRQLVQRLQASRGRLPQEIAVRIIVDALKGLHYAHERTLYDKGPLGIVHRDISPQNILLSVEGDIKVTDFGIAKAITQTHETQTGVLKGKYAYMSPEQALGRALDRRSDLFSMGIVLYEMLMGNRLFAGSSDLETLEKVRKAQVPWPRDATAELLPGLREVVAKALARERTERFPTAEEFAGALESCLPEGRSATPVQLAMFFQGILAQEPKGEKIERQTLISPGEKGDTVSLVEAPRELLPENVPGSALPRPAPRSRAVRWLPWVLGLIWLGAALGLAWWLLPQLHRSAETSLPSKNLAPVPIQPATFPPPAKPPPRIGSLEVTVIPPEALLKIRSGDREERALGKIKLPDLPEGTILELYASLAGYEDFSEKLKIASDEWDVKRVVQLKKKPAANGNLRINAIPWGQVTVAGLVGGQETPVVRSNIKVGVYKVLVSNPSIGKTVTTQVNIRPDVTTVCTADFEGNARIRCH